MTENLLFPDIGLHLGVLNSLLELDILKEKDLKAILKPIADSLPEEADPNLDLEVEEERITAALDLLHQFQPTKNQLGQIIELSFDGGNDIYMLIEQTVNVDTGGTSDYYLVGNFEGIEHLPNLEKVNITGYAYNIDTEALDGIEIED